MAVASDVTLGEGVVIHHPGLVNLYGCVIGAGTGIGAFVEIQAGATVGACCKIQSHSFICAGVAIEDEVFIGHGVMFTNDRDPAATDRDGRRLDENGWTCLPTRVCARASIGSNATILPGVTIGAGALIGAGAVVASDIPANAIARGVPARVSGYRAEQAA